MFSLTLVAENLFPSCQREKNKHLIFVTPKRKF